MAKAMVSLLIDDLIDFYSFNRAMGAKQIVQTVDLIIDNYPSFTPEDFIICFNNIKLGKYGKLYEGIDGAKILDMIHQYDTERDEDLMEYHKNRNKELNSGLLHESIIEVIKPIVQRIEETKKTEINLEIKPPVPREITEDEVIVQEILKEFDVLHSKKGHTNEVIRTISYKNEIIDQGKYLEIKLEEMKLI